MHICALGNCLAVAHQGTEVTVSFACYADSRHRLLIEVDYSREEKYAREARAADAAERPSLRPGGPVQLSSECYAVL